MLDDRENDNVFDMMYETGLFEGMALGLLETYVGIFRRMKKLDKKKKGDDTERLRKYLTESLPPEKYEELASFIRKYPKLSNEKLAKRILKETEFHYI